MGVSEAKMLLPGLTVPQSVGCLLKAVLSDNTVVDDGQGIHKAPKCNASVKCAARAFGWLVFTAWWWWANRLLSTNKHRLHVVRNQATG